MICSNCGIELHGIGKPYISLKRFCAFCQAEKKRAYSFKYNHSKKVKASKLKSQKIAREKYRRERERWIRGQKKLST